MARRSAHAVRRKDPRGSRLHQVINETVDAFSSELKQDGDPNAALMRLSEDDAVRIINIHKCKGLEFEKVGIFGVEHQLFWGDEKEAEFFVAISRAKTELLMTWAKKRPRPTNATGRWDVIRLRYDEFWDYAFEPI